MRFKWLPSFFVVPAAVIAALALASCQTTSKPAKEIPAVAAVAEVTPEYLAWLGKLRQEARQRGISEKTITATLLNVTLIPRVVELDRRQPEFSQTFWRYFDGAINARRIAAGQQRMTEHRALLEQLEARYGVPGRFLVAFWGMETDFGRNTGGYPVIGALVTLAYDGRRAEFFRGELFNALNILDHGHITPALMKGSWAGAMGQTQFMPSTFMKHAVDADGDGHKNIWTDVPDALASAANYLKALQWNGQQNWGREVRLPSGFDVGLASLDTSASETVKSLSAWSAMGVTQADGQPLPQRTDILAALILPAGAQGPAFLVYDNFRAILKWNRSTFYAIAVGHLADRLINMPAVQGTRVTDEPLRREEVLVLQAGLHKLRFLKNDPDGVVGGQTRLAIRAFQHANGLAPDGYASRMLIAAVSDKAGLAAPFPPPVPGS